MQVTTRRLLPHVQCTYVCRTYDHQIQDTVMRHVDWLKFGKVVSVVEGMAREQGVGKLLLLLLLLSLDGQEYLQWSMCFHSYDK